MTTRVENGQQAGWGNGTMAGALRRMAETEPELAARLIVQSLPVAAAPLPSDLSWRLDVDGVGAWEVTGSGNGGAARVVPANGSDGSWEFSIATDPAGLASLAAGSSPLGLILRRRLRLQRQAAKGAHPARDGLRGRPRRAGQARPADRSRSALPLARLRIRPRVDPGAQLRYRLRALRRRRRALGGRGRRRPGRGPEAEARRGGRGRRQRSRSAGRHHRAGLGRDLAAAARRRAVTDQRRRAGIDPDRGRDPPGEPVRPLGRPRRRCRRPRARARGPAAGDPAATCRRLGVGGQRQAGGRRLADVLRAALRALGAAQLARPRARLLGRPGAVAGGEHRVPARDRLVDVELLRRRGEGRRRPRSLRAGGSQRRGRGVPRHPTGGRGPPRGVLRPLGCGGDGALGRGHALTPRRGRGDDGRRLALRLRRQPPRRRPAPAEATRRPRAVRRGDRHLPHGHRGSAGDDRAAQHPRLPRQALALPGLPAGVHAGRAGRAPPHRLRSPLPARRGA